MKRYLYITKMLIKSAFRFDPKRKKQQLTTVIALGILGGMFSIGIAISSFSIGGIAAAGDFLSEAAATIMLMGFVVVLFFGIISIFSSVYFSKDSEFLFSLPAPPSVIFLAKLTVVYLQELMYAVIIILPGLLALGISSMSGVLFYVMILIAVVLVPVCPMLLASILAIPLIYVSTFFKNKGGAAGVVMVILFALIMSVYMYISLSFATDGGVGGSLDEMIALMQYSLTVSSRIIYPLLCLARFGTLTLGFVDSLVLSVIIDLAVFLATIAVGVLLTIIISGAVYKKSALRQGENAIKKQRSKAHTLSSPLKALIKKEWRECMRNPSFAFQCLAGALLGPIISAIMMITMSTEELKSELGGMEYLITLLVVMMIQLFAINMNIFAATAVTREGKSYIYSKQIPVPYSLQARAKLTISRLLSVVSLAFTYLAVIVASLISGSNADYLIIILSVPFSFFYAMAFINIALHHDYKRPRLDWVTPHDAVKGNIYASIPVFVGMALGLAIFIFSALVIGVLTELGQDLLAKLVLFAALTCIAVLIHFKTQKSLFNRLEKYYSEMGI